MPEPIDSHPSWVGVMSENHRIPYGFIYIIIHFVTCYLLPLGVFPVSYGHSRPFGGHSGNKTGSVGLGVQKMEKRSLN